MPDNQAQYPEEQAHTPMERAAASDGYFGWIIGSLAVCRVCSAMVPDHTDAQLNHQRWHAQFDGSKRPPELSPEERKKRADQRDRGVLNERSDDGDACGCPCHQVVQPGLVPCPRCEQEGTRP